jgi:hypothetical protein
MPPAAAISGQQADRAAQLVPVAVAVEVDVLVLVSPVQVPCVHVDPLGSQLGLMVTGWPPVHVTVIELVLRSIVPVPMICPELFLIVRL